MTQWLSSKHTHTHRARCWKGAYIPLYLVLIPSRAHAVPCLFSGFDVKSGSCSQPTNPTEIKGVVCSSINAHRLADSGACSPQVPGRLLTSGAVLRVCANQLQRMRTCAITWHVHLRSERGVGALDTCTLQCHSAEVMLNENHMKHVFQRCYSLWTNGSRFQISNIQIELTVEYFTILSNTRKYQIFSHA